MNYNRNNVKSTINVDWFQCMFLGYMPEPDADDSQPIYLTEETQIQPTPFHGNKYFKHSYYLFHRGEELGVINCHSRSEKIIKGDVFQFKLNNENLYRQGWTKTLIEIAERLDWKLNNISRLDIAIDGEHEIRAFVQHHVLKTGKYILKGKASLTGKDYDFNSEKFRSIIIGSPKSEKLVVCYDKDGELDRSNKNYIKDFWINSGLINAGDDTRGIERVELRLKSEALRDTLLEDKKLFDSIEDLSLLESTIYLASICKLHFNNFFEFISKEELQKKGNVSRCEVKNLIPWDSMACVLLNKRVEKPSDTWRAKLMLKDMFIKSTREEFKSIVDLAYLDQCEINNYSPTDQEIEDNWRFFKENSGLIIDFYINKYNLSSWYERKTIQWSEDIGIIVEKVCGKLSEISDYDIYEIYSRSIEESVYETF